MGHRPKQHQLEVVAFPSGLALDEDVLHLCLDKNEDAETQRDLAK